MSKIFKRLIPLTLVMVLLSSLSITAFAGGGDYYINEKGEYVYCDEPYVDYPETEPQVAETVPPTEDVTEDKIETEPNPFTPDGQATVVDEATDDDGKEFYTFTTPNENVFYLIIDKQRDSENVYFLNAVTEDDLMKLAEQSEETDALPPTCICEDKCEIGAVNAHCPVCKNDMTACTGEEVVVTEETEPPKEEKETGGTNYLFILIALACVGGVGYYIKVVKPKKDLADAEDLDEVLDNGEVMEDGKVYNEDDFVDDISNTVDEVKSRKINVRKQQNTEEETTETTNTEQEPAQEVSSTENSDTSEKATDTNEVADTNDDGTDNDDPNADYMNGEDIEDNADDYNYPPDAFDVNNERKI